MKRLTQWANSVTCSYGVLLLRSAMTYDIKSRILCTLTNRKPQGHKPLHSAAWFVAPRLIEGF